MSPADSESLFALPMKVVALLLIFVTLAVASKCPNPAVATPFNVGDYLGIWYEIATTPTSTITFEHNCYCTRANYTLEDDGSVLVQNSCNRGGVDGQLNIANGTAIVPDPTVPAKLSVTFGGEFYAPYWVIINDNYESAVVWSCTNIGLSQVDYMWVLSRSPTMSTHEYQALTEQAAQMTGYDINRLKLTTQQGCTYPTHT